MSPSVISPPESLSRISSSGKARSSLRLVEGWYAHNAVLVMLGVAGNIVATVASPSRQPWLFYLVPVLHQAQQLRAGAIDNEELAALRPDMIFLPRPQRVQAAQLCQNGIPAIMLDFRNFGELLAMVDKTAHLLGTDLAKKRARDYRAFVEKEITALSMDDLLPPLSERPRIVHLARLSPLQADGNETIIAQWISLAGGVNAARISGDRKIITAEQLLAWNPDILIIAADAGPLDILRQNVALRGLKALQKGKIFRNPAGIFLWERYGPELALQLIWARQIFADGQVDIPEMKEKIRDFYRDFYNIILSEKEAGQILLAQPPL